MQSNIRVGDVMTRNFIHVNPDTSLLECAKIMIKNRVGSLVLKNESEIYGILTEKDIIWAITKKQGRGLEEIKAKDVSTRKLTIIKPEAKLSEALEKMNKKKVRRLPVISNKKIIGLITLKDILKFHPRLFESLNEFEVLKEESEKIERSKSAMKNKFLEAPCEECGNFDLLEKIDNRMICESCKDRM